jgi:hypothetical protein
MKMRVTRAPCVNGAFSARPVFLLYFIHTHFTNGSLSIHIKRGACIFRIDRKQADLHLCRDARKHTMRLAVHLAFSKQGEAPQWPSFPLSLALPTPARSLPRSTPRLSLHKLNLNSVSGVFPLVPSGVAFHVLTESMLSSFRGDSRGPRNMG